MDRRKFLRQGSAAAATLGAFSVLPGAGTAASEHPLPVVSDEFPLEELTIHDLQRKMETGEMTSRTITQFYLDRIKSIDQSGPGLHSVIEINPDALKIADECDLERKNGKIRTLLHGIPVMVKDNIDTADKMKTSAGSIAMEGNTVTKDAFIISQLREAGAVLLGKTNLSEWANFRSTRSSSGWSSRGGQTRNPYVLDRSPCGSSSGSAVAVAANLCALAVGTETDGSVICPSSFCGIVGIKPTVGLISRSGIIPISQTQDTAGPMARTVKDAAILLGILAGADPDDPVTASSKEQISADYFSRLSYDGLSGKRIGIEKSCLQGHDGVVTLFRKAMEVLKSKGATCIEVELLAKTKSLRDAEFEVLKFEFKDGVNRYFSSHSGEIKSLSELIAFNKLKEPKAMPYFKQEILEACEETDGLGNAAYREALAKTTGTRKIIDDLMQTNRLDAIAGIGIGPPHLIDLILGDYDTGYYFCSPAAMAGYPHITIPMGQVSGLPVGFSLIAGSYREHNLINMAYAYEQASKKRMPPGFLPTTP